MSNSPRRASGLPQVFDTPVIDNEGQELANREAARKLALRTLSEMSRGPWTTFAVTRWRCTAARTVLLYSKPRPSIVAVCPVGMRSPEHSTARWVSSSSVEDRLGIAPTARSSGAAASR